MTPDNPHPELSEAELAEIEAKLVDVNDYEAHPIMALAAATSLARQDIPRLLATVRAERQRVAELEGMIEDAESDGWCFKCSEYVGTGNHYHCAQCGEVTSMMGHLDAITGKITCKPVETGEGEQGGGEGG